MSLTRKVYRAAYIADRVNRGVHHPTRFVKNRAKSRALGAVGYWRMMSRFWRA